MSKIFDYALSQVPDDVKRFIDNSFEIANEIHDILARQGKTQKDLALMLGKSESEVSKWLTGRHNFTIKSLSKIEAVLNEKIIATPIQNHMDFLKMAENAIVFHDIHFKATLVPFSLEKNNIQPEFVEVTTIRITQDSQGQKSEFSESYAQVA